VKWLRALPLIVLCNCSSSDDSPAFNKIVFGQGGGFTGYYDTFELTIQGSLSKIDSGKVFSLKTVDQETMKEINWLVRNLSGYAYSNPGNFNQYVYILGNDTIYNQWRFGDPAVDVRAVRLYRRLEEIRR